MSGDLEEFLKRAAQRRRERAMQQQAQQPKPRQRPEYTDRRAERAAPASYDQEVDEAPMMAEVIADEDFIATIAHPKPPARPKTPERKPQDGTGSQSATEETNAAGLPAAEVTPEILMEWLRSPAGLKQAILIHEILDRPTHRWE